MASSARRAPRPKTADQVGTRLLEASARNSYDPEVDVDWDAPLVPGMPFMPFERVSLYGTDLWDGLDHGQRVELSKHETASIASVGLWFEVVLIQLLVRYAYDLDPRSPHAQYALTEIGDETRHSIMFAKAIAKFGVPAYGAVKPIHEAGRVYKALAGGPSMFGAVLVAEEATDRLQRATMDDEGIQPIVRAVNRIHVVEEARHVRYAREAVLRDVPTLNRAQLEAHRWLTALTAVGVMEAMVNPAVYRSVGIDPKRGRATALANPHHRETRRWMAEKVMAFLTEAGLVGGPSARLLKRSSLL